jgi:hypothetical protein
MQVDFPCVCGHGMDFHIINSSRVWDNCKACHIGPAKVSFHTYKPDNLKYLEQLSKE